MATAMTQSFIDDINRRLQAATTKTRVQITKSVVNELLHNNVITKRQFKPGSVIVQRTNRDGYGINAIDVHQLLADFLHVGFDESLTEPFSTDPEESDKSFTERLIREAAGKLGELTIDPEAACIGGCHTTFVLRIILDSVLCGTLTPEDIQQCTINGKLNVEMIRNRDANLGRACDHGLTYTHIPKEAVDTFPLLLDCIQSSCNAKLDRGENELHVLSGKARRQCGLLQVHARIQERIHGTCP